jgi:hypothetical protein
MEKIETARQKWRTYIEKEKKYAKNTALEART